MKYAWCAVLVLAACAKEPATPAPQPQLPARRPVAQELVAKLELEAPEVAALEPQVDGGDLAEHVDGLLVTLGGTDEALRRIAREELASLGPHAIARVAGALTRSDLPAASRKAAAQVLAQQDSVVAARALLERVEFVRKQIDPEPWMRAQCAWRLGETTQDWVVPRLLLCLRYETDYETVTWLASTLAHFGNFAALEALRVIATTANANDDSRALASAMSGQLSTRPGLAGASDAERAWAEGDPEKRLPDAAWSPRHQLEIARMVSGFREWQLRGVDDARFVIAREGAPCAELLAAALADENRYVRTHAVQCLERMGPRAKSAGPALLAALDDPEVAVPATIALGALRYGPASTALVARLDARQSLEQRLAAARALGHLGVATAAPSLRPLRDAKEPYELRVASVCALAALTPLELERAQIELLVEALASGRVETLGPETALAAWLAARAPNHASTKSALEAWNAATSADPRERVAARAQLFSTRLDALFAP